VIPSVTTVTGNVNGTVGSISSPGNIMTTAMTEAYSTDGGTKTPAQALYEITQYLHERAASGTTETVKKVDGSTSAYTLTINDATTPTSVTRAT
jgi:hypothetical protein